MTNFDSIRRGIVPSASDSEVNALLWNCSPFPFLGDIRKLRRSIRRCLSRGEGTVAGAIDYAHRELDEAMAEYNSRNASCTWDTSA